MVTASPTPTSRGVGQASSSRCRQVLVYLTLRAECSIMPLQNHDTACAKTGSCALTPFSVACTTSISGRQRAIIEFLRMTTGQLSWSGIYKRRISCPNQLIDNGRRPLGATQMRTYCCQRNLEKHETGSSELGRIRSVEMLPCKFLQARFYLSPLGRHLTRERLGPPAANEVIPMV